MRLERPKHLQLHQRERAADRDGEHRRRRLDRARQVLAMPLTMPTFFQLHSGTMIATAMAIAASATPAASIARPVWLRDHIRSRPQNLRISPPSVYAAPAPCSVWFID